MKEETKKDITNSNDIKLLVDSFYKKIQSDNLLSKIFEDAIQDKWNEHLPIMYSFWGSMLLGDGNYKGNPFRKHIPLPINKKHFEQWLYLFDTTIDEYFTGINAQEAKLRAKSIAYIFQTKLEYFKSN